MTFVAKGFAVSKIKANKMFSYFGAKVLLVSQYPAPLHDRIIEPFAGSAAYSTAYPDRDVVLVDKYPVVARLWKYLIRVPVKRVLALPLVARDQNIEDVQHFLECEEERSLICFWLQLGMPRPQRASTWFQNGEENDGNWSVKIRQRIADFVPRIRHWTVIEGDYFHSPSDRKATWFIDPPYQRAGSAYVHGAKSLDFKILGAWCRTRPGQVIVCENLDATWLPFRHLKDTQTVTKSKLKGTSKISREAIWTND